MYYMNISNVTKKFYDTEFKPGEIKESKNYINDPLMIAVDQPAKPDAQESSSKPAKAPVAKADTKQKGDEAGK